MEDHIGKAFGLEDVGGYEESLREDERERNLPAIVKRTQVTPKKAGEDENERDYQLVRANLIDLIDLGNSALNELFFIAKASQHPRSYEVLSQLIKTLGDQNRELIGINLKVKESKEKQTTGEVPAGNLNVNNAVFVGSTKELQKMIRNGDGS